MQEFWHEVIGPVPVGQFGNRSTGAEQDHSSSQATHRFASSGGAVHGSPASGSTIVVVLPSSIVVETVLPPDTVTTPLDPVFVVPPLTPTPLGRVVVRLPET